MGTITRATITFQKTAPKRVPLTPTPVTCKRPLADGDIDAAKRILTYCRNSRQYREMNPASTGMLSSIARAGGHQRTYRLLLKMERRGYVVRYSKLLYGGLNLWVATKAGLQALGIEEE